jgi:tetratricopeptide (TPR) repeat protein
MALRVGDLDKAKKMYQIVLKNNPDQQFVQKRYKILKQFMKMMSDIDELLEKSKNHQAVRAVNRARRLLEEVLGKEVAATSGTRLFLFECSAKSRMTFHDDAIEACNTAIAQFENHDNPDPRLIAEAYAWRAEANMRDRSYDDAVADLRVATTKLQGNKEYQEKLREAEEAQTRWNKSEEKRDRRGEALGHFTVNRPHRELLDLPDNIDELDKEDKCTRLKKNFRKMGLRWHPDKAKGGKKRAQRKSSEIFEAKEVLELEFGCKRRGR